MNIYEKLSIQGFINIGIVGSRTYDNYPKCYSIINDILIRLNLKYNNITIISGGAKGVDTLARKFAIENNISIKEYLPEYDKYNKIAPLMRNSTIVENSDMLIVFWDMWSKGTKNTVIKAYRANVPIYIYNFAEDVLSYPVESNYHIENIYL